MTANLFSAYMYRSTDWFSFSLEIPFVVKETDLVGLFAETTLPCDDPRMIDYTTCEAMGWPDNPDLPPDAGPIQANTLGSWNPEGVSPDYVAPEPITLVLMGSGLAGIGAIRARRRKKDELA